MKRKGLPWETKASVDLPWDRGCSLHGPLSLLTPLHHTRKPGLRLSMAAGAGALGLAPHTGPSSLETALSRACTPVN